jgi:hypothetical protein
MGLAHARDSINPKTLKPWTQFIPGLHNFPGLQES